MILKILVETYIAYRRSLGEKFVTNARELQMFVNYAGLKCDVCTIDRSLCESFLLHPKGKVTANWFCKHTALKGFFQWAVVRGHIAKSPLPEELPRRPEHIRPYVYSDDELRSLFRCALTYQKNKSAIYPECVREILVLTYLLGLRIHETLGLKMDDIDLDNQIVTIDDSKFYKTRLEPFNGIVKKEIITFLTWRKQMGMPDDADSPLFLNRKGLPMLLDSMHDIFRRICAKAGIFRSDGAVYQPRLHDLRHTFAVNRLIAWYDAGEDVQHLLPTLSTYMGHTHIAHTSVYLTMTDRLLDCANSRFESYVEGGTE